MPDWRRLPKDSEDLRYGRWTTFVKGEWGPLRNPGINGLYSVFACMRWLLEKHYREEAEADDPLEGPLDSEHASDHWKAMLDDIQWVVIALRMAEQEEEGLPPRKRFHVGEAE
jgi:hypothetical protein